MPRRGIEAFAASERGGIKPQGCARRRFLNLVSRCFLIVALPISSVPDALREVPPKEMSRDEVHETPNRSHWTSAMEREFIDRWMAYEAQPLIARNMSLPATAVRARASRLHLPVRDRTLVVWS